MSQPRTPRTSATGGPRPARAVSAAALGVLLVLPLAGCSGDDAPTASATASTTTGASASASGSASTAAPSEAPSGSEASGDASATDAAEPAESTPATGTVPGGAAGEVVEGFPTDVVPVYPGAEVLSTVATTDGAQRDVSLNGRTTDAADAVLEFYRQALVAAGFAESAASPAAGVTSATFSRSSGAEVLQVAVISSGGGQQFTVGGTINP